MGHPFSFSFMNIIKTIAAYTNYVTKFSLWYTRLICLIILFLLPNIFKKN